ncbi:MAG: DMT family transporter [Bacteroidales bacterium]|nr:DMT family transporter [Bacteroidales bacterium]
MNKKTITYISICIAMFFWGFSFIWSNQVLKMGMPVFALVFFRMTIAGVVLLAFTLAAKKLQLPRKKDLKWFLLLALTEPFLYFIGETFGMKLTASPTLCSVVIATIPIFSMVFAMSVYRERVSKSNMAGIFLTLPGICIVVFENGFGGVEHPLGVAMLFLAVFSAVGYSLVVKKLSDHYNSITVNTWQHVIGAIYFIPLFFIIDFQTVKTLSFTWELMRPILLLAIFCSCLCYFLFINTIKELGISRTSTFTSLIPVITAVGAFTLGEEALPIRKIVGIAIVVTGLILSQYTRPQTKIIDQYIDK